MDKARDIRPGEELNEEALQIYLQEHWPGHEHITQIKQFPGGYSNLTYALNTNQGEYVLRRPPFGANIKTAHDMGREFRVLNLLQPHYDKIPQPILICEETEVIGAPFYVMERVQGVILRNQVPKDLDLTRTALDRWVKEAEAERTSAVPLDADEQAELKRLRKEVDVLRMERDFLRKAAAFFARDDSSRPSS